MKLENLIRTSEHKKFYRDGNYLIKAFDNTYSLSQVLGNAWTEALLNDLGLSVRKINDVSLIDGMWCIVFDYIEGDTLKDLYNNSSKEEQSKYMNLFTDLQVKINSIKSDMLQPAISKYSRYVRDSSFPETVKFTMFTQIEKMNNFDNILHCDFVFSNIIISKKDNTPMVLDWNHATKGNIVFDICNTYLYFIRNGRENLANEYLMSYYSKNKFDKKLFTKLLPIMAVAVYDKYDEKKKNNLLNWCNPIFVNDKSFFGKEE